MIEKEKYMHFMTETCIDSQHIKISAISIFVRQSIPSLSLCCEGQAERIVDIQKHF